MRMHRSVPSIAVLAMLASASVQAVCQETQDSAEPAIVFLQFSWPVDTRAHIEGGSTRIQVRDGRVDSMDVSASYDMVVSETDTGLLIEFTDFEIGDVDHSRVPAGYPMAATTGFFESIAQSLSPAWLVSRNGEFQGLPDYDQYLASMRALVSDIPGVGGSSELQSFLDQFLSEDIALAYVSQEWNVLVGFWVGGELELGAAYEFEAEEALPMFGGAPVLFRYEFGITERVRCTESDMETRCVELVFRSWPDPEAVKALIEDFVGRIATGVGEEPPPDFAIEDIDIFNEIVVVTEPSSLLPHLLTTYRSIALKGAGEDGERIDMKEKRYTYVEAAGA